jgi:cobalt-zinc-cadmium efflux system protein
MGHGHSHTPASRNKKRLAVVFVLTTTYLIAEIVGGLLTDSLALLADAGHMLTDAAGLGLALLAIQFAEKPATPERTYGYYRVEILAALTNAVILIGISIYILYEAYERFKNPLIVASKIVLLVALVGLIINVVGILVLRSASTESLNMQGAYYEVFSDLLTSIG